MTVIEPASDWRAVDYFASEVLYPESGDTSVACRQFGAGPALVLIHGFPLHGFIYGRLLHELSRHFTCYVFDMLGAGESRWTSSTDFSFPAQARALRRALDRLDVENYAVLAHDTGGSIARHLALRDAPRLEKLLLINTEIPNHRPPWIPFWGKLLALPGSASALRLALRSRRFLHSSAGFAGCFEDPTLIDTEFHRHFVRPIADSARRADGYRRYLRGFDWRENDRMAEQHRLIRASVSLLWGRNDPTFPEPLARRMAEQFSEPPRFVSIPETRLLPHAERPEQVLRHALPFLKGATAARVANDDPTAYPS